MELATASTPPPPSDIHTPPAPKLGYHDSWEPYSPRKSARLAQKARRDRTPSPQSTSRRPDPRDGLFGSPRPKKESRFPSLMATPVASPQKKRTSTADSSRRVSGTLTADSTATAATTLGLPRKSEEARPTRSSAINATTMLPTPSKTPQKPPSEKSKARISSVARNLFPNGEEVMPSPRKSRAKKHVLDSFFADDVDEPIPIYTDSHERVPEVDKSTDNPFYGPPAAPAREPAVRRSKRQQVHIPGEGIVSVDEAIRREDGILTVFRGRKQFRKFAELEESSSSIDEEESEGGNALDGATAGPRRPLTRSSIKPRLLFPVKSQETRSIADEDEEAATDIEDHTDGEAAAKNPHTPLELVEETPGTPAAPKFAPASPPPTGRTTRFGSKATSGSTPMKASRGGKRSPFDGWRRVKSNASESHGQKRAGDALAADPPKRTRA